MDGSAPTGRLRRLGLKTLSLALVGCTQGAEPVPTSRPVIVPPTVSSMVLAHVTPVATMHVP